MPPRSTPLTAALACAAALTVAAGCSGPSEPPQQVRLAATGDTLTAPYGDITEAGWLGGTRWVVIAPQDRAVSLADFDRKTLTPFGGRRSTELEQPFRVFTAGDSVFVADWLRRRTTSWSRDGVLGGERPAVDAFRGALPRARDAAGRWYFELPPAPGPDGSGNRDSTAIVRTAPDMSHPDTVARLAPIDLVEVVADGRRRLERRLLSGQDRWGVLPDGRLWIARVGQSRVDWVDSTGRLQEGRGLPDKVLPVTEMDRDLFLQKFEPELRATVSQTPFTAIKPPFDNAVAGPDGILWLAKNRAIGDTLRDYQLVDDTGRQIGAASHRGLGRILAVADGVALVGEPFENGMRLLLYRIERPAGTAGS